MNMRQPCPLSEKEKSVTKWLAMGKTMGETAEILGCHLMTVSRRMITAREKTGDYTLHGFIARSVRNGWVE